MKETHLEAKNGGHILYLSEGYSIFIHQIQCFQNKVDDEPSKYSPTPAKTLESAERVVKQNFC